MPHGRSQSSAPDLGHVAHRGGSAKEAAMINTDIPAWEKKGGMPRVSSFQDMARAKKSDLGDLARHPDERGRSPMFDGRPASIMEEDEEESPGPVGAPEAVDTALRCNINRRPDIVWQENPPRVLKYRTSHLHYWGYLPGLIPRNLRATVLANPYLHVQTAALLIWCGIIHKTGIGASVDLHNMWVQLFGAQFIGGTFNPTQIIIFIQGLFVTLVINRWSQIRALYAKIHSVTVEIAITACTFLQPPIKGQVAPEKIFMIRKARAKLARYLNLGHILTVMSADAQSKHFPVTRGVRFAAKHFKECLSGDLGGDMSKPEPEENAEGPSQLPTFGKASARDIGLEDLHKEGLLTLEEWAVIEESVESGLPQYLLPYQWSMRLVQACVANDLIQGSPPAANLLLTKLSALIENCTAIFTQINAQLPYPYVALVSFAIHFYLFVLATWFGSLLHGGFPSMVPRLTSGNVEAFNDFCDSNLIPGKVCKVISGPVDHKRPGPFTIVWCYIFLAFANLVCQGYLDIHTLTDSLFGNGPARFPLRAQVTSLINCTRGILAVSDTFTADGREPLPARFVAPRASGPGPSSLVSALRSEAAPIGTRDGAPGSQRQSQTKEGEQQRDRIWQADALGIIENQPAPARLWSELDAETAGPGLAKKQLGTISVVSTGAATMLKEARENDNAT